MPGYPERMLRHPLVGLAFLGMFAAATGCSSKDESVDDTKTSAGDDETNDGGGPAAPNDDDTSGEPTVRPGTNPSTTGSDTVTPVPVPSPDDGIGGAGSEPTPSATGSTPAPVLDGHVAGDVCTSDADCTTGLTCLLQDDKFFSPDGTKVGLPGGYCTTRCETNPDVCSQFGDLSVCVPTDNGTDDTADDVGYCMEACQVGQGISKCEESVDRLCLPLQNGIGLCAPFCLDDLSCAEGSFCDPATGLCLDSKPKGKAIGETCKTDDDCVGKYCLMVSADDAEGLCSANCVLLPDLAGCGLQRDSNGDVSGAPDGLCGPVTDSAGVNDVGVCIPACDTDEDCKLADLECSMFTNADAVTEIGRAGLCMPKSSSSADGGVTTSPDTSTGMGGAPGTDAGPVTPAPTSKPDAGAADASL